MVYFIYTLLYSTFVVRNNILKCDADIKIQKPKPLALALVLLSLHSFQCLDVSLMHYKAHKHIDILQKYTDSIKFVC